MSTVPLRVYVALRGGEKPICLGVFDSPDRAKDACLVDAKAAGLELDAWGYEQGSDDLDLCAEWTAQFHTVIETPFRVPAPPMRAWRN